MAGKLQADVSARAVHHLGDRAVEQQDAERVVRRADERFGGGTVVRHSLDFPAERRVDERADGKRIAPPAYDADARFLGEHDSHVL